MKTEDTEIAALMHKASDLVFASIAIKHKDFGGQSQSDPILKDLAFDVRRGELLGIIGPSGCGKTTLLRIMMGLDTQYEGTVVVEGSPVIGTGSDRGLVFQESRLLPWRRVFQNIDFALPRSISRKERHARVREVIERVGLKGSERLWPHELSGGMIRRVAIARAIVNLPRLLLMDEPFSSLDDPSRYALQREIAGIHVQQTALTTIFVTHDIDEAVYLCDRIFVLSQKPSSVIQEFPVPLERPRDRTSQEFHGLCSNLTKVIFASWDKND